MSMLPAKSTESAPSFYFGNTANKCQDWVLITDNVMGGITKSNLVYNSSSLLLTGDISLANYGGFSSIKTRYSSFNLEAYKGVKIRYRSTGQKFAFTLEDSRNWTSPNYKGAFAAKSDGEWEVTTINFKDFKQYQVGQPTGKYLNLSSLKNLVRLGVITTEKNEGPFSLEIDYIEFIK